MKQKSNNNKDRLYLLLGAMSVLICGVIIVAAWTAVNYPVFASFLGTTPTPAPAQTDKLWAQVDILKPEAVPLDVRAFAQPESALVTDTPSPVDEPSVVATDTPPVLSPTLEPTITPTETPAQLAMEIIPNTPTSVWVPPTSAPNKPKPNYASSGNGARWIDVDLSNQSVYAYEGDVVVNSFVVSTGTWRTPTVTGQYNIYVKYRSARMSGPGYSLPNVPYIMYFYGGYGLHGTYWHNNFGTPMSHGCINLRTDDAAWLYNWASVGTLVNIHY